MKTEEQKKNHNEYMRQWRKNNPEKVKAIQNKANKKFKDRQQQWRRENKERLKEYERTYVEKHSEKIKLKDRRKTLRKYGLTLEQYEILLLEQSGVCAICKLSRGIKKLAVDHDHNSGKVRGLLCQFCNTALGKFLDDVSILKRAISYLEKSSE